MPGARKAGPNGLILDGSEAPATVRALAQAADDTGGTLWVACHLFRRDPITLALMSADHVDHRELNALLAQVRETLR